MAFDNNTPNPFLPGQGETAAGGRILSFPVAGAAHSLPNPATGEELTQVGWVGAEAVGTAVRSAEKVAQEWANTPERERAASLRKIAESLLHNITALAELISAESGKPIAEAHGEVAFSARYFEWFAEAATTPRGEHYLTAQRRFLVQRKPVGVVAAISPWNFPLSIPARKVAAALAAGCPVVQKASELTPLSSLALTEICEPHLPDGAISVLVGDGQTLTNALVDHPAVRAVTFTGSTTVGKKVAERAMRSMTRVTMELGGRAPFIVCDDADLEVSLNALIIAKFRNNGASCLAANNVYIHDRHYDQFVEQLSKLIVALVPGNPRDPSTNLGPVIRMAHVTRLEELVASAQKSGNRVWKGTVPSGAGWFMPPTLIECVTDTPLWSEEIFGPVCAVRRFSDESAVVAEVNSWRTGLGGYIMSTNVEHQITLASELNVGIVAVNNGAPNTPEVPFGGIGDSGLGREGGLSGMFEFTEEQTISMAR